MFYEIGFKYDKECEIIKTKISDSKTEMLIYLKIYTIKGKYYIDVYNDSTVFELGRLITTNDDLLAHTKRIYTDFPKVELRALSLNDLGDKLDFSFICANLGLQELFIIV